MNFIWKALIAYIERHPEKIHDLVDAGVNKLLDWLSQKGDSPKPTV